MIDRGLAQAVKEMNKTVEVYQLKYLDESYKESKKNFSIVLVVFTNNQRFEINKETYDALFYGYVFRMRKGVSQ